MPSPKKALTYTGLINNVHYRDKDIDSREVLQLLRQAKAIPQQLLPFKGIIHVIDYTQHRHVGISGPCRNMFGYDPQEIFDNGLEFVISIFQKDDFKIYNETIFCQVVDFLNNTPQAEHGDYLFSYSYRMKKADGKWMQLFQQGSYITDPKTRLPLYGIGVVTDISPVKKDTCMMFSIDRKTNEAGVLNYNTVVSGFYYPDPEESRLSRREREILGCLAEGLSSKQIADKFSLSENTVVNHRKNMLKKANAKNVAELVSYGIAKGLI